jgi:hypothetical protein
MGGRLPAHWLSSKKLQWNWGEKSVQLDDGSRLVSISMVGEQLAGINITWSSGWFSKSRIRVTMTQSNTAAVYGGESVSGKLEAPLGYNLRWTEI